MARILAIDYGTKRTGLAATDPLQIIAQGLTTVATGELMDYLKNYMAGEAVEKIVVGYPLGFDDRPTEHQQRVDRFVEKLGRAFPDLPIALEDESYTSKNARHILWKSGLGRKKRRQDKGLIDRTSAVLILQQHLGHI